MERYRFGKPDGRYIGQCGNFQVYSNSIVRLQDKKPPAKKPAPVIPGQFEFYYGPATGGLIESTGIKLFTTGEAINAVDVNPCHKKRVIRIRGLSVEDALLRIERINGFHSASHAIAFLLAVEDALGIEVTGEVQKARIMILELERIRSNLEVLKRLCEPAGFGVPVNQLGYLREKVSRTISDATGHRFFFGVNKVSGASVDFSGTLEKLAAVRGEFNGIFNGLQESRIFLNRLQNNGITGNESLVGPAARAAGLPFDARADSSDLPYSEFNFTPVVRDEKDSFGRFMVRGEEILQSLDLINSVKVHHLHDPSVIDASGSGEGASRIESPQGDLFYYVRIEDGTLLDVRYTTPSELNIKAFEQSMVGNIFTDFHFNWESFGIWISEMGVEFE